MTITRTNAARVILTAAHECMGDGARGDHRDVIHLSYARLYDGPTPPVDDPAIEAIATLAEQRHEADAAITGEWPAEYAATLMLATFGTPNMDDAS